MDIQGSWEPLRKFKTPVSFTSQGWFGTALNKLLYRPLIKPKLKVRRDLCTRCEVCIQHCPAQALSLREFPFLDEKKCISCYCCYELCPSQAMELTSWMKRLSPRDKPSRGNMHRA
jgi:ferredoxin